MTRADAWIYFAAAGILDNVSSKDAAITADELTKEFDKRFEPVPLGVGYDSLNTAPDTFQERKSK